MLEHVPGWLGSLMRNVRAGHAKLLCVEPELGNPGAEIDLSSPAFANGARLPERFTADGEGVSPPLVWGDVPAGTVCLALVVEDPDAPTPNPLVHAIMWGIAPQERRLAEGAIIPDGEGDADGHDVGRNSYFSEGWLPPDPPTGHGAHDYVFQLFALSETPVMVPSPGRAAILDAIKGNVLGTGLLTGTYSRGEQAPVSRGDFGAAVPA
ncbi:YbhB/YbcL family Raf kinase inhibitor-like protein [Sphingomonas sp. So64.6b]|uniref:YbhB/YbcL family Raf kinase inhibitor-like protein n=1 Tax=Sphingomonas sp. So64.6b TaxID=2997354 RepID=UPI001602201B|nr:YbhB/YbcL family Raf kinase inhibitor-like protein [Sphingomonas sp. So64.6b]QNA85223.1 YbhB/YbcL family Raf kinase inhibitor-like protein [Sphingomonas sp. So64.6b]